MTSPQLSRRDALCRCGLGLGALGLADLLIGAGRLAAAPQSPLASRAPHFAPKAKRVLHIFPVGGPSHVDTFDPKPTLTKYHGKPVSEVMADYLNNASEVAKGMGRLSGKLQQSGFKFARHGQSGIEVSELFPRLAQQIDDLCIVRSMSTKSSVLMGLRLSQASLNSSSKRKRTGRFSRSRKRPARRRSMACYGPSSRL
jgi:hypothetical protein